MAAQAERSLLPARKPYSRVRIYAPEACVALLVVVIGAAGLIAHSWPRQMVESWINIHLLFGFLLCGWLMVRYRRRVSQKPGMVPAEVRGLSRQLSRIVYCVLYGVIGLKQSISIVSSLRHGGAVDFNLFDEGLRHGPDTDNFDLRDDFQMFLASALVPLVIVRVMTFRLWTRLTEKSIGSKPLEPQEREPQESLEVGRSKL
jgi:cytochrome b561